MVFCCRMQIRGNLIWLNDLHFSFFNFGRFTIICRVLWNDSFPYRLIERTVQQHVDASDGLGTQAGGKVSRFADFAVYTQILIELLEPKSGELVDWQISNSWSHNIFQSLKNSQGNSFINP